MKKIIFTAAAASLFMVSCARSTAVTGPKYTSSEKLLQGKTVFENSCNKCHALPEPSKHTDAEWINTLSRMAPRAKLTPDQHQMVYDYLISQN
ncbi:MAG: cytochrome C [Weeksellaceae bacterium]|nr:cytochrome C [Weeksellaceae bacterium]